MKRRYLAAVCAAASISIPYSLSAEQPATKSDQIRALVKDIRQQQALITDNQAKIDEKLAALAETVRTARIFSSRSGR